MLRTSTLLSFGMLLIQILGLLSETQPTLPCHFQAHPNDLRQASGGPSKSTTWWEGPESGQQPILPARTELQVLKTRNQRETVNQTQAYLTFG